jgi:MFS family permease
MNELSGEESRRSYYGWVVVGVAFLAQLLTFGLAYSFGVFLKPLAEQFGWSRAATGGVFSAYAFIHNFFAPITGKLSDKFGPKLLAILGGFCVGLTMLLMGHGAAIWQVYVVYVLVFSLGAASTYTPLLATVSRWFTEKRGLAIGITTSGTGAGTLVFSPLAAWLITSYGWRMAYTIVGVICWAVFAPIVRFVRQAPKKKYRSETGK